MQYERWSIWQEYRNHACMCNSDMPRIHVTMITIYAMTVFRASVYLYIGGIWIRTNSVTCHSMCIGDTCTWDNSVPCDRICKSRCSEYMHTTVWSNKSLCNRWTWIYNALYVNYRVRWNMARSSIRVLNIGITKVF